MEFSHYLTKAISCKKCPNSTCNWTNCKKSWSLAGHTSQTEYSKSCGVKNVGMLFTANHQLQLEIQYLLATTHITCEVPRN